MIKTRVLGAGLALCAAFSITAEATLYKWVDDQGETHYGEVIPPEYADRDKVKLEKGREVAVTKKKDTVDPGKKTPEDQALIDQQRKDKALLNTYSNVREIDLARDRNLQQVNARIDSIQMMQKSAQEALNGYLKEAENFTQSGKKIPASLQSDITGSKNRVATLQQDLTQAQEKSASVKASFEADKVRYRELTGATPEK